MAGTGIESVLASVSEELAGRILDKSAEVVGMLVRDSTTKKILGHLQETNLTQSIVGVAVEKGGGVVNSLLGAPLQSATGVIQVIQNEQIKGKLKLLESMLGGMQALQMATLVSSVAGMGVTVASTAIILSRMQAMDRQLEAIGDRQERVREEREDWDLRQVLSRIEAGLQQMAEADFSKNAEAVVRPAETSLNEAFMQAHSGLMHIVRRPRIDAELLTDLISRLSMCSMVQVRALIWLDEKERALSRVGYHLDKLSELTLALPQDKLVLALGEDREKGGAIDQLSSNLRLRLASLPSLVETLIDRDVHGRAYLERAAQEDEEPVLLLAR